MSNQHKVKGKVSFIQNEITALEAGEYQLTVSQTISAAEAIKDQIYSFGVHSERFQLHPAEILKVFPPDGSKGEYALTLPHVVLSRTSLPWDRGDRTPDANQNVAPWLAVLLFDQDDPSPTVTTASVKDVQDAWSKELQRSLDLEYGQSVGDPCQIIDLPVSLWNQVAPSKQDLFWLAHIRTTDVPSKAGTSSESSCALVIGNRLPRAGKMSTAHLVSLEDLQDFLPDKDGNQSANIPSGTQYVRLVSLKSWQFTAVEEKVNFTSLLENLNASNTDKKDGLFRRSSADTDNEVRLSGNRRDSPRDMAAVALPPASSANAGETFPLKAGEPEVIKQRLDQGYTALTYQTRTGHAGVSWYHGPFVPYSPSPSIDLPIDSSDKLIYCDSSNGLYDTSYAAAWQIGRLLALANRGFATRLRQWKIAQVQTTLQKQGIKKTRRLDYYQTIKTVLTDPARIRDSYAGDVPQLDTDLVKWLADLYLLKGVPFPYLVPDKLMLPQESLRFFQVDPDWLACLVDGAMSIGRATKSAWAHDQAFASDYLTQIQASAKISANRISGFILRSQVIKGWWPGIRVDGYDSRADYPDEDPLPHLRFETLSDYTLLAMFDGEIHGVNIHEPSEGIHFGLSDPAKQGLKYISGTYTLPGSSTPQIGQGMMTSNEELITCGVPMRDAAHRVLDIDGLATGIKDSLLNNKGLNSNDPFTAAEFALEMVEGVQLVAFRLGSSQ